MGMRGRPGGLRAQEMGRTAEPPVARPLQPVKYNAEPMSRTLARFLIGFLLALTIPLQGLAAATAGMCMALGHHGGEAAPAMDHDHAGAHHAGGDAHAHGGGDQPSDHSSAPQESSGNAHCPPCSSCCAAAAIAPAVNVQLPHALPSEPFLAGQHSIAGFLPDELDRPPLPL